MMKETMLLASAAMIGVGFLGGFLGMGAHLVVVPYDALKFAEKK